MKRKDIVVCALIHVNRRCPTSIVGVHCWTMKNPLIPGADGDVLLASSGLLGRNIMEGVAELRWVQVSAPLSQVPRKSKPPLVYVVQMSGWRFRSQLFS